MGVDVEWQEFFHDNLRYADIINGIGCDGIQMLKDTDLQEVDTTEKNKHRDLLRRVAMGINFAIVGIENQEKVDYRFPLRNMHYDVTRYNRQASEVWKKIRRDVEPVTAGEYLSRFKKESKLYPQVTFVLYAGKEVWDGPRSLHDMLDFTDIPEGLQKMVADYKINIVDIRRLEDMSVFQSDVRQVFEFIRCSEDKAKLIELVEKDSYYQSMDDEAFNIVTKYANAKELVNKEEYKEEGGYNVCKAIQDLMADSRLEGRLEGRLEERDVWLLAIKNFFANGASYEMVRASVEDITDEELQRIYKEVCA